MLTPDTIAHRLRHPVRVAGYYMALCPFHDDHNRSLQVGPGFGFKCHGCGEHGSLYDLNTYLTTGELKEYYGRLKPVNNSPFYNHGPSKEGSIEAVYVYVDEAGRPLYKVVRYSPKDFRPRKYCYWGDRLLGTVRGLWGRRVMYRLPEILRRKDEKVVIVEGEKDADRLFSLGILATTFAQGVLSWSRTDLRCLDGRDISLIPDNDAAGISGFAGLARCLAGRAARVTTVQLPDLPVGADVSDWLDAGHTKEDLLCMIYRQ